MAFGDKKICFLIFLYASFLLCSSLEGFSRQDIEAKFLPNFYERDCLGCTKIFVLFLLFLAPSFNWYPRKLVCFMVDITFWPFFFGIFPCHFIILGRVTAAAAAAHSILAHRLWVRQRERRSCSWFGGGRRQAGKQATTEGRRMKTSLFFRA